MDLQEETQSWLMARHRNYRDWHQSDYDCMISSPREIVALDCVGYLEWRNSDGGLGQVFSEVQPHWHKFLELCQLGYEQIGASIHAKRIDEVRVLFTALDPEFSAAWSQDLKILETTTGAELHHLRDWVSHQYGLPRDIDNQYFYTYEVLSKREQWLLINERAIRSLMVTSDLERVHQQTKKMSDQYDSDTLIKKLIAHFSCQIKFSKID
jgi:hypothetical protein